MKGRVLSITAAGAWITAFEFARNEFLLKHFWTGHFARLGLVFETRPINGILWTAWSLGLAALIARLQRSLPASQAFAYAWLAAFPMMWVCLYNLQVLPVGLLAYAIPLSLVEVAVAMVIIRLVAGNGARS